MRLTISQRFMFSALALRIYQLFLIVNALGKFSFATPAMNIVFNDLEKIIPLKK